MNLNDFLKKVLKTTHPDIEFKENVLVSDKSGSVSYDENENSIIYFKILIGSESSFLGIIKYQKDKTFKVSEWIITVQRFNIVKFLDLLKNNKEISKHPLFIFTTEVFKSYNNLKKNSFTEYTVAKTDSISDDLVQGKISNSEVNLLKYEVTPRYSAYSKKQYDDFMKLLNNKQVD